MPTGTVTRGQMASFLDRALEYLLGEPVTTTDDYYTDDTGDVHELSINDITSVGIAGGRAPDTYAPRDLVDRDNMAAFLARTLGELQERGATKPLPAPAPDDITVVDQDDVARDAVTNPDSDAADDRTYTVTGLAPGEEYRVTLVEAGTLSENADGDAVFTEDGDTGLAPRRLPQRRQRQQPGRRRRQRPARARHHGVPVEVYDIGGVFRSS